MLHSVLLIKCNSSLFKRHKNVNNLYKLAKKVSNEGEPPEYTNLVDLASHMTWRWVKMASKANKISDALNSARASNLNSVVNEERRRALFEEYLSDSEEEEGFEESIGEDEGRFSVPSSSTGFGGVAGAGVSESDEDEEDVDLDLDLDLVVVVGRDVELEGEVVLGRDPELAKIVAYVCGCSLKLPSEETGCIKQSFSFSSFF